MIKKEKLKMRKFSLKLKAVVLIIALLTTFSSGYFFARAITSTSVPVYLQDLPSIATFVVKTDGAGAYWAVKYDGSIPYSGTSASIIQTIINAIIASGDGGSIYITPGVYVMPSNTPLIILSDVYSEASLDIYGVRGDSGRGTMLSFSGVNGGIIIGTPSVTAKNVHLHGLTIQGDGTSGSKGLELLGAQYDIFENLRINNFYYGLIINSSVSTICLNSFTNIDGWRLAYGLSLIGNINEIKGNSFRDMYLSGDTPSYGIAGIYANKGSYNKFSAIWLDQYTLGIYINDSLTSTYDSMNVDNSINGIQITNNVNGATGNTFINPQVVAVSGTPINSYRSMATKWYGVGFSSSGSQSITGVGTISHFLFGTPTFVSAQAEANYGIESVNYRNINSTSFEVVVYNIADQATESDPITIHWYAEYQP